MRLYESVRNLLHRSPCTYLDAFYQKHICRGGRLYEDYTRKYGENAVVMLCPYPGTGDTYIIGMFLNAYIKENQIANPVIVVVGKANEKVMNLFGFPHIEAVKQIEADELLRFYMFMGDELHNLIVLHHDAPLMHTGILENMRNYNGINFIDQFLFAVFQVDFEDRKEANFRWDEDEIQNLFRKNGLTPGKTVILSPYVNTLPSLPWWVWVDIAAELTRRGYTVCTNCGTPKELPINGTVPLTFDFDIAVPVLEKAGYFIGIRSGFCDIISSAKCKKIIVYQPYLFWGCGRNIDYFSLNRMGLTKDTVELEYEGVEFLDLIDDILSNI